MIGLVVQNILISRKCNKYKQENEKLEEKIYDEIERLKDIKVEIQNTILEQAYEKGQIDALEKIKADLLNLEFNFHYDWATTKHIIEIIDKHISELKGENNG